MLPLTIADGDNIFAAYSGRLGSLRDRRELIPTTAFAPLRSACLLLPRANLAPQAHLSPKHGELTRGGRTIDRTGDRGGFLEQEFI
jgi:hypothetical protein